MHKLSTKSVQEPSSSQDGLRLCVMRRVKPEFEFDLWLPHLAPSTELLQNYQDQTITWEEFKNSFIQEMASQNKYFELTKHLLSFSDITLLCWEESPEYCHRSIIVEMLKDRYGIETP